MTSFLYVFQNMFSAYLPYPFLATPFVVAIYFLDWRLFTRYYILRNTFFFLHITFAYFPHLLPQHIPFLLVHSTLSHDVNSSILLCHKGPPVHLRPPPCDYWYTHFLSLADPSPLHEMIVSARFCVYMHWALQIRFHSSF